MFDKIISDRQLNYILSLICQINQECTIPIEARKYQPCSIVLTTQMIDQLSNLNITIGSWVIAGLKAKLGKKEWGADPELFDDDDDAPASSPASS